MNVAEPSRNFEQAKRYVRPARPERHAFTELLRYSGRSLNSDRQLGLLQRDPDETVQVYTAGDLSLLQRRSVSIVGTREVSDAGWRRAQRLARELVQAGVVVTSGLAKGVDTAAHTAAIAAGGSTVAVIGTPLEKAYPAENAGLQEEIYVNHLLVSPFAPGERTFRSSFPKRNRVMALLSDATVIVEATDTSGTLHQAAECLRQGRWLFILQSVVDNPALTWPSGFVGKQNVVILERTEQILERL